MTIKYKKNFPDLLDLNICIIGLGYVGLPLAIEFSKIKNALELKKTLKEK